MQWILGLIGLVLGGALDESLSDAIIGGLFGLGIAQAIRLASLHREQQRQWVLTREALAAVEQRLASLEALGAPLAVAPEAPVAEAQVQNTPEPEPTRAPQPVQALPELLWELPPILEPVLPVESPADPWRSEPAAHSSVPALPREPNLIERAVSAARAWLFGGNTVLRVGVVLLFLGLAFLLRYATEGMSVPIELRYAGVAGCALGLLGLGWWLRSRSGNYGLILQGTGIGVLYLTVFAAMRLHPLLDPTAAFGLLVAVTVFSAILAVKQNALSLAAAAALGGFAAPILASTGSGSHVALFSYFALLNAGIFAIAWFKAWRLLNLIGFAGTFGIGFAWGVRGYTPELLWSTEPFLILFFLMYLAIGLLFARRKLREREAGPQDQGREGLLRWSARQGDYVDGTLLFGPPLVGFGLQWVLVQHVPFAAAFSALALGALYMGLARVLAGGRTLLLSETCLALGVIFASLAIPLGLDARWTTAAWAVEGAGIFWLGLRQQRPLARAFALLLQFGAALVFLGELRAGEGSLLDGSAMGALLLGCALLSSFYQLHKAALEQSRPWERALVPLLASVGLIALYLLAPLIFGAEGTTLGWALAGLVSLLAGLRLGSRSFLINALAVQLLAAGLFLIHLQEGGGDFTARLSGWIGLLCAALPGLCLIAGVLWMTRIRRTARSLALLLLAAVGWLVLMDLLAFLAFSWHTATGVWVANGLLSLWLSLYLRQRMGLVAGLLLQIFGGGSLMLAASDMFWSMSAEGLRPLAHGSFWAPVALGLAALIGAWCLQRGGSAPLHPLMRRRLSQVMLGLGAAWWGMALVSEVSRFVAPGLQAASLLMLLVLSMALGMWLAVHLRWKDLGRLSTLLTPLAGAILLDSFYRRFNPAEDFGWLVWPLVFVVHFYGLRRLAPLLPARATSIAHIMGCWLLLTVLALELRFGLLLMSDHYNGWRWLGWALLPSLYLLLMAAPRQWPWPVAAYSREYRLYAALPLAVMMLGWFWLANAFSDGSAEPLPYVPLLNPLELGLLFALFGVYSWSRSAVATPGWPARLSERVIQGVAGISLFAFFSLMVMRGAHHWAGISFELEAQLSSMLVQAALSLVWTVIALGLMIGGHLRHRREVWLVGAGLIALVVAKLFFVELSNRGGLARIVSFIGVGGLLLVVGYFAPLPPRREQVEPDNQGVSL